MPPLNIKKTRIKVVLWGTEIGTLTWNPIKKNSYFNFSPEYFKMGIDICPITHPANLPTTRFAIDGENARMGDRGKEIYQSLPPFIADSLPDKWGNAIFDRWFAENKKNGIDKNPLVKLSFLGKRAMGALEFQPEIESPDINRINLSSLYQEALALEKELSQKSVDTNRELTGLELRTLGTSAGGRQMKIILSKTKDGHYISGQTSTDKNCKHYILKFNQKEYCLSEIEKTFYDMAILSGIEMTKSGFETVDGLKHFITERFDRKNGEKIFTQTLAAINPSADTYEDLFYTCIKLELPQNEITELFRRTAFNFLTNNTDDHRKNFSFMMGKDGIWHLAPAYDLTFIISTDGNKPEENHCMSLRGKFSDISKKELIAFAKDFSIKGAERIIEKIEAAKEKFKEIAEQNGINSYYQEMIENQFQKLSGKEQMENKVSFKHEGHYVKDVHFEKTLKGNLHMLAKIDDQEFKLIITPKKPLYKEIIENGFNQMPNSTKKQIFINNLYPIVKHKLIPAL